jgi:Sulfotransferase family
MGLLEISRTARRSSPVFIIGEARSGSSMLYRILLQHPTFAPRAETLQESSFIRQAPMAYRFTADHPSNMRRKNWRDHISEPDANLVEELLGQSWPGSATRAPSHSCTSITAPATA